jgi:hypothetical protein
LGVRGFGEGDAKTIAVRCDAACTVRHIADGPAQSHAEAHIVWAALTTWPHPPRRGIGRIRSVRELEICGSSSSANHPEVTNVLAR